jgi:hypothetical protein
MSTNLPTDNVTPNPNFVVGPGGASEQAEPSQFVDRRSASDSTAGERRQFGSSHSGLSDAGRELALAIDQYKLQHHRRYITCDEMLTVLHQLGYSRG